MSNPHDQNPPTEIHRCDKCGERTRHIVVLVARDHSQDIMPKDPRKAFWQAFTSSSITNWAFGETLAYQTTHVKHLICETLRGEVSGVLSCGSTRQEVTLSLRSPRQVDR